jgi:hypothetical protein
MLLDAILKLHDKIQNMKLGATGKPRSPSWSRPGCEGCHLRSRSAASE